MLHSASPACAAAAGRGRQAQWRARAAPAAAAPPALPAGTEYEVTLEKPLAVKFARGSDGGAYVVSKLSDDPAYASFTPGDKIVKVSASFGEEVWDAQNYVIFAIKTRNGSVFLRMRAMGGDLSAFERTENTEFTKERRGGNYGAGTQELQRRNYVEAKERERERVALFNDGIKLYEKGDFEAALIVFENVLEPKNYVGDRFEKVTPLFSVGQYNVACCYSKLGASDASLDALQLAMSRGFDDFERIRGDPSLAALRAAEPAKFKALLDKYDEPWLNEGALKLFGGLFGSKK